MVKTPDFVSPQKAISIINSKDHVFVHTACAAPQRLIEALAERSAELEDVQLFQLHTEGGAPYALPEMEGSFRVNNLFVGGNLRKAVQEGRADYIPVFLSEVPGLFRKGIIKLDAALLMVSPPDNNGYCTLGTSVDGSIAAAEMATRVIAEINSQMPRTHGDANMHISNFDRVIEVDYPLPSIVLPDPSETDRLIGGYIAELVEDGATLQMGIGTIPNAALEAMKNHKGLGVHTEMFSDGLLDLVETGVVTNEHKVRHRRHTVTSFAMGSKRLYNFIDDNPSIRFMEASYVNDTAVIRQNPKVTAINSAIEIDLTGQVCADSIGPRIYSGVGGQMDFVRGASLSNSGKPIIALPSVTRKGLSRITSMLKPGAGVVTTRAHVHYVVTENGIANLYGQPLRERARRLIRIAHPDHRELLAREAFELLQIRV